jgi:small subunit ribosomal protein S20
MANTKQAKKRAAQNLRRRERNRAVVTKVRHAVRDIRKAVETGADKAQETFGTVVSDLDRAVRKGVLHRNTASRLKSRVSTGLAKAKNP